MCLLLVLFPKRKPFVCLMHDRREKFTQHSIVSVKCLCEEIAPKEVHLRHYIPLYRFVKCICSPKDALKISKRIFVGSACPKKERLCMNHRVPLSRCFRKPLVKRPIKSSGASEIKPNRVCSLVRFTLQQSVVSGTWAIYTNL